MRRISTEVVIICTTVETAKYELLQLQMELSAPPPKKTKHNNNHSQDVNENRKRREQICKLTPYAKWMNTSYISDFTTSRCRLQLWRTVSMCHIRYIQIQQNKKKRKGVAISASTRYAKTFVLSKFFNSSWSKNREHRYNKATTVTPA